jgi:RND superfamily putative drug exporter
MRRRHNIAATAAHWSARHRRIAIGGWLAFVLACFFIGGSIGQRYLTDAEMGNGESGRAARAIDAADFPKIEHEQVLVQGRGAVRIRNGSTGGAVVDLVGRLMRVPYVINVSSPLAPGVTGQLTPDRRSALVTFDITGDAQQARQRVVAALAVVAQAQRANPQLRIEEFGEASANRAIDEAFSSDFQRAERTSLPVTLVILLFAFGSLVAAGIPLLLGMTAVVAAIGLLGPLSHLIPVSQGNIGPVVLLIGLAVGVDYSMFYLRRKLEERHAGHDGDSALALAAATSGRAVLVSGLTVMTAMAGMFLAGNAVFTSFAMGTMLVVAVAVAGSLTVLPAVIAVLGDGVEKGRVPFLAERRARGDSRVWGYLLDRVLKRPAVSFAVGAALLLALAVPALGMRTVDPGFLGLPRSIPIMHTYDRIQAAFPGGPQPSYVVVQAHDVTAPAVANGIARMARAALATREIGGPVGMTVSPDRSVAIVSLSLAGNGTDRRSDAALATLRHRVIPATLGRVPAVKAGVTGLSAGSKDFNDRMKARLPLVFGFVLGLAFLLLLRSFKSVVIAGTAIVLNLLSVGAAYGILKLVFQDGHLRSLLGFTLVGGIIDWLPLFLFVVLFGLSMDYHVLIISRIREEHDRGLATKAAVSHAIRSTAGVVTSAAIVMVAVFSIFATLSAVAFKQLGVGLAVAVLLDATVVRGVLLPSAMTLLGDRNWWTPSRPSWLRARMPRRRRAVGV